MIFMCIPAFRGGHSSMEWALSCPHASVLRLPEIWRTGEPALGFLKAVFMPDLECCRTLHNEPTYMVPLLFHRVRWERGAKPQPAVARSEHAFLPVALLLAVEVLLALSSHFQFVTCISTNQVAVLPRSLVCMPLFAQSQSWLP